MPESAARGMPALSRLHTRPWAVQRRAVRPAAGAHGAGRVRWSAPPGDMAAGRFPLVQAHCPWSADMLMPQADSQQVVSGLLTFLQPV